MTVDYGIDTTKEVTPLMVREAIVICFSKAHCDQLGLENENQSIHDGYCRLVVKKAFTETKGDFENPTKASLLAVLPWLADFSKSFRNQSLIQQHINEIKKLINFLKD